MEKKDCENCRNNENNDCQVCECKFEPREYKDFVCIDCKHFSGHYDKNGWLVCYCTHEEGRGTDDEYKQACEHLELTYEAREAYFDYMEGKRDDR